MDNNAFARSLDIYTNPNDILDKINIDQFHSHVNILKDDLDDSAKIAGVKDKRLPKTPKHTMISYDKIMHKNTSGVRGVTKKIYKDKFYWVATIQKDAVNHRLYSGSSFDDAVAARKKAEAEFGNKYESTSKRHSNNLPSGVYRRINNGKIRYQSFGYIDKKRTHLYSGPCLSTAIHKREQWQKEMGLLKINGKVVISSRYRQSDRNTSGNTGVYCEKGKYWCSVVSINGVRYTLCRSKNKEDVVQARLQWEKDNHCFAPSYVVNGLHQSTRVMNLFNVRTKILTTKIVMTKLKISLVRASATLTRMYKRGVLCRTLDTKNNHTYFYTKADT